MARFENVAAIEKQLWSAADVLSANSSYASNEYFPSVMGLAFRRHAYRRCFAFTDGSVAGVLNRGGRTLLKGQVERFASHAQRRSDLVRQIARRQKLVYRLIETCENGSEDRYRAALSSRDINRASAAVDEAGPGPLERFSQIRYFRRQARRVTEHFSETEIYDMEGLVKHADLTESAVDDRSLTPGRVMGVAPKEVDEDYDFKETLCEIHVEREDQNPDHVRVAATCGRKFEEPRI